MALSMEEITVALSENVHPVYTNIRTLSVRTITQSVCIYLRTITLSVLTRALS